MAANGKLGTSEALGGNLLLAGYQGTISSPGASNSITFSQTLAYNKVWAISVSNTITLVEKAPSYPRVLHDTVSFVGVALNINNIYNPTASNTITISQDVEPDVYRRSYQTLTFSQTLVMNAVYNLSPSNSVTLVSQEGDVIDYTRSMSQSLTLTQDVNSDKYNAESPSNTITFVNIATASVIRRASQTLTFSQVAIGGKIFTRNLTSTITLSQAVLDAASKKTVNQTITFVQAMNPDFVFDRHFSDTVSLVQVVNMEQLRIASNTLTFTDSVTSEVFNGTYGTLTLSQSVSMNANYIRNGNFHILALAQTVVAAANRSLSASNTITLAEAVTSVRARFFTLSNVFFPHDTVIPIRILLISQTLSLDSDVTVNSVFIRSVGNSIVFDDTMNRNVNYTRAFADVFPVVNGYNRPVNLQGLPGYTYIPSTVDPTQPAAFRYVPIPGAMITKVDTFVSFTTPGYVLYLQQPDFGDSEGNLHKVIEHRTVSGKLYTHVRRQPGRALKYKFEISRAKAEESRWFMLNYLSTPMYLTNWKGEIWYGFITNNPFKIESKRRAMPCNVEDYEINVEFEGVRIH